MINMTFRGHIEKGQILLDEPVQLPEGARVTVDVDEPSGTKAIDRISARKFHPVEMPGDSLADEIIRERR